MRVALLSLIEPGSAEPGSAPGSARGYLRIGGQSIARHQLGLALALGCSRIVFLAQSLSGELVALQHVAEDAGAQFHVIAATRALAGLIAPDDELIVLGDGLVAMPDEVIGLLNTRPGVLVLPVESGLGAGFERIDINHSEAGAMRLPGRIAAGLAELPGEWSAPSALMRLAMQSGVPQVPLPPALLESGRWALVRSEEEAHRLEPRWLRLHTASDHRRSPGEALGAVLVQWLGPAVLHAGTRPAVVAIAAAVTALLGLGSAWFGAATLGFVLLGLAWLLRYDADLLGRIERDSLMLPQGWFKPAALFSWGLDLLFVVIAAWRSEIPPIAGVPVGTNAFAPLVLFGLLRLLPLALPRAGWTHWLGDRLVAGLALALASAVTGFDVIVMAAVAGLIAAGLIFPGNPRDIAPNPALTKQA